MGRTALLVSPTSAQGGAERSLGTQTGSLVSAGIAAVAAGSRRTPPPRHCDPHHVALEHLSECRSIEEPRRRRHLRIAIPVSPVPDVAAKRRCDCVLCRSGSANM